MTQDDRPIAEQLAAFNETRRRMLDGRPFDPEGVEALLPPWGAPGGRGPDPMAAHPPSGPGLDH